SLARRRNDLRVRHAVGDQHGGQLASDAGQGHDTAVHILWWVFDAIGCLCNGDVAGVDTRATTGGDDLARTGDGREPDLMGASGAPLVLLAAGGTGGHLFPAEALADALHKRDVTIDLATDHRPAHFKFPSRTVHVVPSATVLCRDPPSLVRPAPLLAAGTAKAWSLVRGIRPSVVVGFGGYPTVPPLLAASLYGVPTILHEQNSVMGRANRFLAPRVTAIATGFRVLK